MKFGARQLGWPVTLGVIAVVVVLVTIIVLVNTHYTAQAPASASPTVAATTQQGQIACLPPKGSGPHTMMCAIGLQADSGKYYALEMNGHDPTYQFSQTGLRVKVTGSLNTSTASDYDIAGSITVSDIAKTSSSR
jgi:hypothetical protein